MSEVNQSSEQIIEIIIEYLKQGNPMYSDLEQIPLDESLVELGLMDSFGVIDIVTFLEKRFQIEIEDSEITKEKFGSIRRMSALVVSKR